MEPRFTWEDYERWEREYLARGRRTSEFEVNLALADQTEQERWHAALGAHARSPRRGQGKSKREPSRFAIATGLVALCALLVLVFS